MVLVMGETSTFTIFELAGGAAWFSDRWAVGPSARLSLDTEDRDWVARELQFQATQCSGKLRFDGWNSRIL
jgi:hypothetical protein